MCVVGNVLYTVHNQHTLAVTALTLCYILCSYYGNCSPLADVLSWYGSFMYDGSPQLPPLLFSPSHQITPALIKQVMGKIHGDMPSLDSIIIDKRNQRRMRNREGYGATKVWTKRYEK